MLLIVTSSIAGLAALGVGVAAVAVARPAPPRVFCDHLKVSASLAPEFNGEWLDVRDHGIVPAQETEETRQWPVYSKSSRYIYPTHALVIIIW